MLTDLQTPKEPSQDLFDWIKQEIAQADTRNLERLTEIRRLRDRKPAGYTQRVQDLERRRAAGMGFQNALREAAQGLRDGSLTYTPPPQGE